MSAPGPEQVTYLPKLIAWEVTRSCNLSCVHCRASAEKGPYPGELTLEQGKALADYKRIKRFTLREDEFPKTTTRKIKRFAVEADINTDDAASGD